ncbi:hypothetical protein Pcinc_034495 [Petrolisthes cinctipes]|uniref:Uncharacterized protein n=1 Tax=Petrolisthes cinctipes TaxID=88211 RepID=A0AAE1EQ58_PETCI|nr:hypothetical protein Pcinc_034495 [Petrolisthes cinctipes]
MNGNEGNIGVIETSLKIGVIKLRFADLRTPHTTKDDDDSYDDSYDMSPVVEGSGVYLWSEATGAVKEPRMYLRDGPIAGLMQRGGGQVGCLIK